MIDPRSIAFLVPSIFIGAFGSLYLKKGAEKFTFKLSKIKHNAVAFLGLFLFGLSAVLYIAALKFSDLSVVYPLSSFSYVVIAFLSVRFLGEKMNLYKWAGILLIVLGSFMVVS